MSFRRLLRLTGLLVLALVILFVTLHPPARAHAGQASSGSSQPAAAPSAPVAPIHPVTEDYYGTKVVDPYRYMENLRDPKVVAWFKGQNASTRAVLAKIPGREALLARIKELDESTPSKVSSVRRIPGGRYFYEKRMASENVAKLYMRDSLDGQEKLVLDPGKYPAPPGSHNAISYYAPSWDGKMVAVGVSPGGSENAIIHILNVDAGEESSETIDRARFGVVQWRPDNHSFFYNRLQKLAPGQPATDEEEKSIDYLHMAGTNPASDVAALGFGISPQVEVVPTDLPFVFTAPDSPYAIAFLAHGVLNELTLYTAPIELVGKPGTPWKKICDIPDGVTDIDLHGEDIYLLSHKDAPRFKLLRTSVSHPDIEHAETVLPESEAVLKGVAGAQDALYMEETDGTVGLLKRLPYSGGKPEDVPLPFPGTLSVTASDPRLPGVLLEMSSWARALRIYSFDPQTRQIDDTSMTFH